LAGYYHERYEVSQDPQDIRSSIEKSSEVERRTTADDPIRPDALLPLAKAYYIYNYHDPQPENLEFTIKYSWEASNLYPIGHPSRAESLVVLSVALYGRYQASLDRGNFQPPQKDLDDAIASSVAALGLFPLGDSRLPYTHSQLSTFLFARYQRQRGLDDLRQSVHHARLVSVYLAPEQRPESLIHLGYLLTHLSHDPKNLTELAKCSREALELLSPDDHRRPAAIHNLVTASHRMYVTLNSAGHLDEAIGYNRQLLHLLPYGSAPWYSQLQLHRNLLGYRWNERQVDADFVEMTESAREVAAMESQSYHGPFHPPQTPFSASAILPGEPPTARSYYPLRHRSPGPYYYDDSSISVAGSDYASTGSEKMGIMATELEVNRALSAVLPHN
jgi:tetratricopeptide (TPR) repeat protein